MTIEGSPNPHHEARAEPAPLVYVIDDDTAVVESILDVLTFEGYQVEAFTDPLAALARLRSGARPSVLLLDMVMPEMNGDEVLDALEATGLDVPVVLLSGVREPGQAAARAAAVLPKPCSLDGLLSTLQSVLARPAP
ncbi:response regulator [Chondromyces crocatus]|uniref:Transcriptional regulator n=1 Tax=Chondromyces crocatus TaxID=52 RepID=A0A0K1E6M8_CHOCO|nr:response regulator [Chondromyces crocatus]AKT36536.1 transcriptional regulator [Chondromyces crocatus]